MSSEFCIWIHAYLLPGPFCQVLWFLLTVCFARWLEQWVLFPASNLVWIPDVFLSPIHPSITLSASSVFEAPACELRDRGLSFELSNSTTGACFTVPGQWVKRIEEECFVHFAGAVHPLSKVSTEIQVDALIGGGWRLQVGLWGFCLFPWQGFTM